MNISERYDLLKRDVLGTLPEQLIEIGSRSTSADQRIIDQVLDRLDALAGDYAYRLLTTEDR